MRVSRDGLEVGAEERFAALDVEGRIVGELDHLSYIVALEPDHILVGLQLLLAIAPGIALILADERIRFGRMWRLIVIVPVVAEEKTVGFVRYEESLADFDQALRLAAEKCKIELSHAPQAELHLTLPQSGLQWRRGRLDRRRGRMQGLSRGLGSSIGLHLSNTLKKYGLVDHSVWVENDETGERR